MAYQHKSTYNPSTYKANIQYVPQGAVTSDVAGQISKLGMYGKEYNIAPGQAQTHQRVVQNPELSQWQLNQMLKSGSPLMQRGAAMGKAMAGASGLMNSSMAVGAAQGAMIDRAQPFALSDSDANRQAFGQNLSEAGETARANAGLTTQARIASGELTGAMDRMFGGSQAQALMDEASRKWQTGERQDQNMFTSSERQDQNLFNDFQRQDQNLFTQSERWDTQDWQSNERQDQNFWNTGERQDQNAWQTGERREQNIWQTGERQDQNQWNTSERQDTQRWNTSERRDQNQWQTGEREGTQDWQTGEREGTQDWQSGERLSTQDWQERQRWDTQDWQDFQRQNQNEWQAAQNDLNRTWTSEENMQQRMQDWAVAQLQAYASIGMNREQAMSQVMADIYSNPNLTAAEQRAAAANAERIFTQLYGRPWNPPEGLPINPFSGDGTGNMQTGIGDGTNDGAGTGWNAIGQEQDETPPKPPGWPEDMPWPPMWWMPGMPLDIYGSSMSPSFGFVTGGLPPVG
jgi:hypothetical protein